MQRTRASATHLRPKWYPDKCIISGTEWNSTSKDQFKADFFFLTESYLGIYTLALPKLWIRARKLTKYSSAAHSTSQVPKLLCRGFWDIGERSKETIQYPSVYLYAKSPLNMGKTDLWINSPSTHPLATISGSWQKPENHIWFWFACQSLNNCMNRIEVPVLKPKKSK